MAETNQYQILVRLLDGRTHCIRISTPTVSGAALLDAVSAVSRVPAASLRLVAGRLSISSSSVLASSPDGQFPSASALLRLRGGKGGFGSLLRGAASNPGQKKTSNFDACRDINGRRLRHVNAERRLEEWKAEAADRQLEKLAENFIKKKAKEAVRGGVRAADVDKYLEKFRKDAESCVNAVEESVRASLGKRKAAPKARIGADTKKVKIWLGKKKLDDDASDSASDEDGDEGADAKSIVLDDGNCSNGSNTSEEKADLGSVSGLHSGESSGEKLQHSDPEENDNCLQESMELTIRAGCEHLCSESESTMEHEGGMTVQLASDNGISAPLEGVMKSDKKTDVNNTDSDSFHSHLNDPAIPSIDESAPGNKSPPLEEPLDVTKCSSSAELEVLGLEKLKLELQSRGLKCGGTLQERAARLFLLKTIPLEKLPKKLFAKPSAGGK